LIIAKFSAGILLTIASMFRMLFLLTTLAPSLIGLHYSLQAQQVQVRGAMREVMRNGNQLAHIQLDTLPANSPIYGLGPADSLRGEITVWNGSVYQSRLLEDSSHVVYSNMPARAPFFVYAAISEWSAIPLPDSVGNLGTLENLLRGLAISKQPFAFRLEGNYPYIQFHVVNLPPGSIIRSKEDAHKGKVHYTCKHINGHVVGFYSNSHQGIFTHHDTHIHMHFLSADFRQMGHIDDLQFDPANMQLYLPTDLLTDE
jgi:acetolactate decarboxylase